MKAIQVRSVPIIMSEPENRPVFKAQWGLMPPGEAQSKWRAMSDLLSTDRPDVQVVYDQTLLDLEGLDLDRPKLAEHMVRLIRARNPERALRLYGMALQNPTRKRSTVMLVTVTSVTLSVVGGLSVGMVALFKLVWVSLPF